MSLEAFLPGNAHDFHLSPVFPEPSRAKQKHRPQTLPPDDFRVLPHLLVNPLKKFFS